MKKTLIATALVSAGFAVSMNAHRSLSVIFK